MPSARLTDALCQEVNRRRDFDYSLQPPEAAIDPSEDEVSINAAIVLREQFSRDSPAVHGFFDALVGLLSGSALTYENATSETPCWLASPG